MKGKTLKSEKKGPAFGAGPKYLERLLLAIKKLQRLLAIKYLMLIKV